MRIPLIYADKPLEEVKYPSGAAAWEGLADIAGDANRLVGQIAQQQGILKDRERIAADALAGVQLDQTLKAEFLKAEDSIKFRTNPDGSKTLRTDWQNYDAELQERTKDIVTRLKPKNASPELTMSYARSISRLSGGLADSIQTYKYKVMGEVGKVALANERDDAIDRYNATTDPDEQARIKKNFELTAYKLGSAVDPVIVNNEIRGFEAKAKQRGIDLDDVKADKAIMADPAQASIDLRDSKYLPNLPPKVRQDKIEKAETAFKIYEAEKEKKLNALVKAEHDTEERAIGNAFLKGDLKNAYLMVQNSTILSGDEKKTWGTAIKENVDKPIVIDPTTQAKEIIKINAMISREDNPDNIRNYVTTTPYLDKGNKEQYINKLEANLNQEIKDGTREGYGDIEKIIFPPARGISIEPVIQSPEQTVAIMEAQVSLDGWVNSQIKAGKSPTKGEIRQRAWGLAADAQIPFTDKLDNLEEKAKANAAALKKRAEDKLKQKQNPDGFVPGTSGKIVR